MPLAFFVLAPISFYFWNLTLRELDNPNQSTPTNQLLQVMDLDREVIRDIIAGVSTPGNIGVSSARSAARKILVASCNTASSGAWSGSKPALDLAKTVVEEKVRYMTAKTSLEEKVSA